MTLHNNVKSSFDISDKDLSVFNIYSKLSFYGVVNVNRGGNISISIFISEMCLESNGYGIPSLRVDFSESVSNAFYNSLGSNSWLKYLNKINVDLT